MAYGNSRGSFLDSIPTITKNLLIINVLVWVATFVLQRKGIDLVTWLGLHFWKADDFQLWQFVTYMFMHDTSSLQTGFMHIFFNMFNLYMFGGLLERVLGQKRFLLYYMVCGIGAGIVQECVWQFTWLSDFASQLTLGGASVPVEEVEQAIAAHDPNILQLLSQFCNMNVTVGASGAVFGLLLAFGMSFPNLRMYIIPFPFPIKAKWMVIGYGLVELVCGTQGLMNGVAHFAHIGGMLFGIVMILYWKHKGIINHGYME